MGPDRLTPYQRYVVFCAWVGIGFDLMDSILFNFVAPIAIPDLLGLTPTGAAARAATAYYSGLLTSVMLFGWALGGIAFGRVSDVLGRARTVVATMLLFSLGTGACALAPNLLALGVLRFLTAVGIGGEWAAGATLVAESVPESRRVTMGTVLFTAPPFFVFLALGVSRLFTLELDAIAADPSLSWRLVMGFGALPALAALALRRGLREPVAWRSGARASGGVAALFAPALRARTLGGLAVATTALVTFWVVSAFLPVVAQRLAGSGADARALSARYVTSAMAWFNFGGLLGALAAAPLALRFGRRWMFALYFFWSTMALALVFGLPLSTAQRLVAFGIVGVSVYGVFGAFQFYLPELFPAHLRGTGAGFCLNAGRVLTVAGPFAVGAVVRGGLSPLEALQRLSVVPALGLLAVLAGVAVETRDERLGTGAIDPA